MKKLYSLLVSGTVAFSVVGNTVLVTKNQNTSIKLASNSHDNLVSQNNSFAKNTSVYDVFRALKSFTATQPLQLPYLGKKA